MLVHKESRGVLTSVWNKEGTALLPATFATCGLYGITETEWWFVPDETSLARRIKICYPDFEPVVNPKSEALTDIIDMRGSARSSKQSEEKKQNLKKMKKDALNRGYTHAYKSTITINSLAFLGEALKRKREEQE